jgi:hypothetical protein
MFKHRMTGKAELAGDARSFVARGDRGKGNAGVHHVSFDAVESPEKIEVPPRAAEFAVADRLQADRLLPHDDILDRAVFDLAQR